MKLLSILLQAITVIGLSLSDFSMDFSLHVTFYQLSKHKKQKENSNGSWKWKIYRNMKFHRDSAMYEKYQLLPWVTTGFGVVADAIWRKIDFR